MTSVIKFAALCIVAAIAGAGMTIAMHIFHVPPSSAVSDIRYTDFLSITLTALSLMITVLGIFVAAAGVIGWSTVEKKLKSHSTDYFTKQLDRDGPLRKELEQLFADIAYSGIEGLKAPPTQEEPYDD